MAFHALIIRAKRLNKKEMSANFRFYPWPGEETENPRVGGSIPSLATNKINDLRVNREHLSME
jgi:hypothetical protein